MYTTYALSFCKVILISTYQRITCTIQKCCLALSTTVLHTMCYPNDPVSSHCYCLICQLSFIWTIYCKFQIICSVQSELCGVRSSDSLCCRFYTRYFFCTFFVKLTYIDCYFSYALLFYHCGAVFYRCNMSPETQPRLKSWRRPRLGSQHRGAPPGLGVGCRRVSRPSALRVWGIIPGKFWKIQMLNPAFCTSCDFYAFWKLRPRSWGAIHF